MQAIKGDMPAGTQTLLAADTATPQSREQPVPPSTQPLTVWMRVGENEHPRKRQRRQRQVVRELGGEPLLDHPFFAAEAGSRKNKQVEPFLLVFVHSVSVNSAACLSF